MGKSRYPDYPSLDVVFTLVKERIEAQLAQVDSIDTKSNFILGSATAVISAGLVVQGLTPSSHNPLLKNPLIHALPISLLVASFLVTTIPAAIAYRVRAYNGVAHPETLFDEYLGEDENTTKADVSKSMIDAYKRNEKLITRKAFWAGFSLYALLFEVVVLSSVILSQTIF